jgi:hypothetical protein
MINKINKEKRRSMNATAKQDQQGKAAFNSNGLSIFTRNEEFNQLMYSQTIMLTYLSFGLCKLENLKAYVIKVQRRLARTTDLSNFLQGLRVRANEV